MGTFSFPSDENSFLKDHIRILRKSFKKLMQYDLVDEHLTDEEAAKEIFNAKYVVVSHGTEDNPIFNYGNWTALNLFELDWNEFTSMPSRHSAEPDRREEREELLESVREKGYFKHYRGVRISKSGKRFFINDVTVWNLHDDDGNFYGQAAVYKDWTYL